MVERLALGTVQFGLPYGIANRSGQISEDEGAAILDRAWTMGLDTLDTAMSYGVSEERLGRIGVSKWKVVTKLPGLPQPRADISRWMQDSVTGSLKRLGITKLHGLLLHRSQQLRGKAGHSLFRELISIRDQGLVEKIGISIYDPRELDALCAEWHFDLVQAPFNIADRRLATSGWLERLHERGTEVHARSIFLQGVLLMKAGTRPLAFERWKPLWDDWNKWLNEQGLTPLHACLGFAMSKTSIHRLVVGIDSLVQLEEVLAAVGGPIVSVPSELMSDDIDLIDPTRWKTF
jgi:aryl-alcohol dehydrogenase-like predicted oxidoreductase